MNDRTTIFACIPTTELKTAERHLYVTSAAQLISPGLSPFSVRKRRPRDVPAAISALLIGGLKIGPAVGAELQAPTPQNPPSDYREEPVEFGPPIVYAPPPPPVYYAYRVAPIVPRPYILDVRITVDPTCGRTGPVARGLEGMALVEVAVCAGEASPRHTIRPVRHQSF